MASEVGVWEQAVERVVEGEVWVPIAHAGAPGSYGSGGGGRWGDGEGSERASGAFYTRVVAHNSMGTSAAGPRSEMLISHHSLSAAVSA